MATLTGFSPSRARRVQGELSADGYASVLKLATRKNTTHARVARRGHTERLYANTRVAAIYHIASSRADVWRPSKARMTIHASGSSRMISRCRVSGHRFVEEVVQSSIERREAAGRWLRGRRGGSVQKGSSHPRRTGAVCSPCPESSFYRRGSCCQGDRATASTAAHSNRTRVVSSLRLAPTSANPKSRVGFFRSRQPRRADSRPASTAQTELAECLRKRPEQGRIWCSPCRRPRSRRYDRPFSASRDWGQHTRSSPSSPSSAPRRSSISS